MKKISIIIVSYNVKDYLMQCIRSIYRSNINKDLYEIIVVDNDSHDGSINLLENKFNGITIRKNNSNLGFSKAVNIGLKLAQGKYVCILNLDIIIQKDTLEILLNFCESKNNLGAVGPKVINADGSIQHSCKRSFPTPLNAIPRLLGLDKLFPKSKLFGKYNLTYINRNKIHDVDVISGAFMIVPREILENIGGFDERFFMFGEDIDLCYRIKELGYKIYYNPNTEIIHYKGESVKNAPYDMINVFYSAMNLYFKKYSSKYKFWGLISVFVKLALSFRRLISYVKLAFAKTVPFLLDTAFIFLSFSLSIYLWYTYKYYRVVEFSTISNHSLLIVNFIISWYLSSKITELYKKNSFSITRVFLSVITTFLISSTSTYFISFFAYSRGVLFLSALISILILIGWRLSIKTLYINKIIYFSTFRNFMERRALIIGADKSSLEIGGEISSCPDANINIVGYTDKHNPLLADDFLGKIKYIKEIVLKNKITEIIIREDYFNSDTIFKIIKKINGLNVAFKIIPKENNIILSKGSIERISNIDLMSYDIPFLERSNILIKRVFDLMLSIFLLVLTLPIQLIYYFLGSSESVEIWGLDQKPIKLHFINSRSKLISSIPLLYKIFTGKITFVGSPFIHSDSANPNHILKPGLISLMNLKKFKNHDKIRINNYYIKNQSLTFDIEIILKSLFRV